MRHFSTRKILEFENISDEVADRCGQRWAGSVIVSVWTVIQTNGIRIRTVVQTNGIS